MKQYNVPTKILASGQWKIPWKMTYLTCWGQGEETKPVLDKAGIGGWAGYRTGSRRLMTGLICHGPGNMGILRSILKKQWVRWAGVL